MPAHQHCDLFYPLGWGSAWVCCKLGNAPVLWSGTGSWVLSGKSGASHLLSPGIRSGLRNPVTQTNKQTNKFHMCVKKARMHLSLRSIAEVLSSQVLPGYLITAHHLCAFLMYWRAICVAAYPKKKISRNPITNTRLPVTRGQGLKTKFSTMVRHGEDLGPRPRRFSKWFFSLDSFFNGD